MVQWEEESNRRGRRTRVDSMQRMKFNVSHYVEVESFGSISVIVGDLPIYMHKPLAMRPPMMQWALDLAIQAEADIFAGPLDDAAKESCSCIVCSVATYHSVVGS